MAEITPADTWSATVTTLSVAENWFETSSLGSPISPWQRGRALAWEESTVAVMVIRLSDILGRLPRMKGSWLERDPALAEARRALREAERAYRGRVGEARRSLSRAEKQHEQARRSTVQALQAAERRERSALARANAVLEAAETARELARFGDLRLSDQAILGPSGQAPLSPSVHAAVEPAATLAAARHAALSRLAASTGNADVLKGLDRHPDRLYLLVEAPELVCLTACSSDEEGARRFAEVVNVAALNADRFAQRRSDGMNEATVELEQIRTTAHAEVERLEAELRAVEADADEVEAARRDLAHEEADTDRVELCRAELRQAELRRIASDLEREGSHGP
jgi:hypothetical protein